MYASTLSMDNYELFIHFLLGLFTFFFFLEKERMREILGRYYQQEGRALLSNKNQFVQELASFSTPRGYLTRPDLQELDLDCVVQVIGRAKKEICIM